LLYPIYRNSNKKGVVLMKEITAGRFKAEVLESTIPSVVITWGAG
jgi:hypothetical protein